MRAAGEPEWNFSEKYVFGQSNQLVDRLSKVSFWCYIVLFQVHDEVAA